jgi:Reverse transcriptase (RNA-dependent DNA polymerase)
LAAFVDVRAAYDSVVREVLYAKMLKMGIGGNFLTTIQAFFTSMTADLEVRGFMIGTVDLELGLCQGSPLSPILFNIYI